MPVISIHISLTDTLLKDVDIAAKEQFLTRSGFIQAALRDKLVVVANDRLRLAAAAHNTDIPTEEELYDALHLKAGQRVAMRMRREFRKRGLARD